MTMESSNPHTKMSTTTTMSCAKITTWTLIAVALQITGLTLFVLGFFPVKPALSGVSGPESYTPPGNDTSVEHHGVAAASPHQLRSLFRELSEIPPPYGRLILMVIDGLPAEFVLGKDGKPPSGAFVDAMPYTRSLLANKMAIGYHAKAAPPTVTMPRLKAMVSGAIGGFLDVAFNFNTQAFLDDNLLGQLFRIGWEMKMFGDETWLKLFPKIFTMQDGVSSFFVKDTVQVDLNVSRHLPEELKKDDWDLLILHYLGLDHVGHIGGRNSVLMAPKLREMDDVIKRIHLNGILFPDNKQRDTLLLVVSDHGMTDSGNHGGSSFEETDALALFIGPNFKLPIDGPSAHQDVIMQVDIAPTLALLLGVPIPKNSVGVIAIDCFQDFEDGQRLRALELNSWQLLRLLKAQLPQLSCVDSLSDISADNSWSQVSQRNGANEEVFCSLYFQATYLHNLWKKSASRSNGGLDYNQTYTAYHDFLMTTSEWLTRRVTDKPFGQLAFGILAMVLSCLAFLRLLYSLKREEDRRRKKWFVCVKQSTHNWSLEEIYVVAVIVLLVVSMGSSSMVEEEQYIWHFITSTLCWLILRNIIKCLPGGKLGEPNESIYWSRFLQIISVLVILISARIMRAWHQGGVNWTHLPDISKWLERAGSNCINLISIISGILVISLSLFVFSRSRLNRCFILLLQSLFLIAGCLVLQHVMKYQDNIYLASGHDATFTAQVVYIVLGIAAMIAVIASPWLTPLLSGDLGLHRQESDSFLDKEQIIHLLVSLKESFYLIGWAYVLSWSLLQLLLQQPINSGPVVLLLIQISAFMTYFGNDGVSQKPWIGVVALYFMGMAGHFALGNSNTLATIDVAGAFIGISSHSTLLSGVLMFCITYGSPMLVLLSLVLYISSKDDESYSRTDGTLEFWLVWKSVLAFPLLVPLGINSVLLTAYTVVLLQMRNHLFIWSVFSPKYLYVCATTVSVYIGVSIVAATETYISYVYILRTRRLLGMRDLANSPSARFYQVRAC